MNYNILNLLGTHIKQRCMFNYANAGLAVLHQFLHHTRFQTTHVQYVWGPLHAFNIYDSVRSTSFTNANGLPKSGGSADGAVHHSLVTHTHEWPTLKQVSGPPPSQRHQSLLAFLGLNLPSFCAMPAIPSCPEPSRERSSLAWSPKPWADL